MVIVRTPYRISFCGGGSDYPAWFNDHPGAVLATTINKYCYLSSRWMPPYLGVRYTVLWSSLDRCNRREDIRHPGVRGCLQYLGIDQPFEVNHAGDLPARSGIGSSSAFTVGLLHCLHALEGRYVGKESLARQAVAVEQEVLKETVGIQDQIQCAYGGLNFIEIRKGGDWSVHPVPLTPERRERFQAHLMLFFTGLTRTASEIAQHQIANAGSKVAELERMVAMAHEGTAILSDGGPIERFGDLLDEGWTLKRSMSALVSNAEIDTAYGKARTAGALGGKIIGAGGGGFLLLFVPPEDRERVRWALRPMVECEFGLDGHGTQIVHISE